MCARSEMRFDDDVEPIKDESKDASEQPASEAEQRQTGLVMIRMDTYLIRNK